MYNQNCNSQKAGNFGAGFEIKKGEKTIDIKESMGGMDMISLSITNGHSAALDLAIGSPISERGEAGLYSVPSGFTFLHDQTDAVKLLVVTSTGDTDAGKWLERLNKRVQRNGMMIKSITVNVQDNATGRSQLGEPLKFVDADFNDNTIVKREGKRPSRNAEQLSVTLNNSPFYVGDRSGFTYRILPSAMVDINIEFMGVRKHSYVQ